MSFAGFDPNSDIGLNAQGLTGCTVAPIPADYSPPIRYPAIRPWLVRDQMLFDQLRRREFITLLGATAVASPLVAKAQRPGKRPIGARQHGRR
jgi:hypothetical protein